MQDNPKQAESPPPNATDVAEVDAVLAEFGGDARAAITALLHDLHTLALDAEASTSRGYVRGNVVRLRARPRGVS
jgi:(p)ppGpp synthase/HD superfamily hydrolase